LGNSTGNFNTALGTSALFGSGNGGSSGSGATAVGSNAGYSQVVGTNNTFVGYKADVGTSVPLTNATAIGANALVSASNALILGGTGPNAVTVGIGTATPYNDYALVVDSVSSGVINGGVVSNATGGNIYLGMTNGTHKFRVDLNGVTYADGGFQSSGADFAESFAVSGQRSGYEPGDLR
jgi:hypothetical protein